MDNSNYSRNRHNEHLGVNKLGKNIRKSPLHQPNFGNNNKQQPPQPHVYNISKNDFRNIVQQLTGSPSQNLPPTVPPPRPPTNPPKPPSMRLQKIRPPPLTPMNQPPQIHPHPVTGPPHPPFNNAFLRPGQFGQQPALSPLPPGDSIWANTAESPISAYMRYLQTSMIDQSPRYPNPPPQIHQPRPHLEHQVQPPLLPTPPMPSAFPSPRGMAPPLLPSPTSPFVIPSPSAFLNLWSPRSPYPPLSPGFQYPPLSPGFFSPFPQSGILGPGPQPPHSPGIMFPSSPSGFFPMTSPRWRGPP